MKPPKKRTHVDIRLSHLLRDCSVGAIVRYDKALMVVQDTRYWDGPDTALEEREIRYVDLVKRTLGLGDMKLRRPPVKKRRGEHVRGWVPAWRFPEWTRCNRCGLLHHRPWRKRKQGGQSRAGAQGDAAGRDGVPPLHCHPKGPAPPAAATDDREAADKAKADKEKVNNERCRGILEQVPWVLVHEDGYLADAPWHAIAHGAARNPERRKCEADWNKPYLRVESRQGRWWVKCSRRGCGAERRLPDRFPFGARTRQQPWVSKPPPEAPGEPGWLVGVNDVRVHYPECRTALVIPPESRIRSGSVVDRLYGSSADQRFLHAAHTKMARRGRILRLAGKYRCGPADVETAIEKIDRGYPFHERQLPQGDLAQLEYRALTAPIPDLRPDEDFVTEHHSKAWRSTARSRFTSAGGLDDDADAPSFPARIVAAVDRLVAVHRVKEIMVFDGFRRGWGSGPERGPVTPPDIEGESGWLPALELWGEGLFFAFREDAVKRWENQASAQDRAKAFVERSVEARLPADVCRALSPRFLLCHTLAHLVIRRLEAQAGYPAASLKERIYCDDGQSAVAGGDSRCDGEPGKPMAGVLIYVAVADEHGSLGGLMDLAQPDRFLRLLAGAVEDASWCSFDPVCVEQEGHGPDLLNRAACHACVLVPEPSCICGNRLLDRAFVQGDGEGLRALWDIAAAGRDELSRPQPPGRPGSGPWRRASGRGGTDQGRAAP